MTQLSQMSDTWRLIEPNDRILVAVSGGKDSYALAYLLQQTQRKVPWTFEIIVANLDQGHPGFTQQTIVDWCDRLGLRHHMIQRDTYSVVKQKIPAGQTMCSLCSRLRRGILYDTAVELGCNKLALGHHKDDAIETLLLNQLYSGRLSGMPPILRSDDGRNLVIRPLLGSSEQDLIALSEEHAFPILPCNLCGSQEGLQRAQVKALIRDLAAKNPKIKDNLFASMKNVRPSQLLDVELRRRHGLDELTPTGPDPWLDA